MDDCTHVFRELRKRTYANGTEHYAYQCTTCGTEVEKIPKARVSIWERQRAPDWDDDLRKTYWKEQSDARYRKWELEREAERVKYREQYDAYLRSPVWRDRRSRRLRKDGYRCQAQLPECTHEATEVHHVTYAHLGCEPLWELRSVCRSCHQRITDMDATIKANRLAVSSN